LASCDEPKHAVKGLVVSIPVKGLFRGFVFGFPSSPGVGEDNATNVQNCHFVLFLKDLTGEN